jgi:hypothetical protein
MVTNPREWRASNWAVLACGLEDGLRSMSSVGSMCPDISEVALPRGTIMLCSEWMVPICGFFNLIPLGSESLVCEEENSIGYLATDSRWPPHSVGILLFFAELSPTLRSCTNASKRPWSTPRPSYRPPNPRRSASLTSQACRPGRRRRSTGILTRTMSGCRSSGGPLWRPEPK